MIYASDFRKGITFEINGEPHVVLDFQHVKPGKGAAFVRTKYRNILTGATREEAFNPDDKFPKAHIETKVMQYLYNDGELYYFMDSKFIICYLVICLSTNTGRNFAPPVIYFERPRYSPVLVSI